MIPLNISLEDAVWHMNHAFTVMCIHQEQGDSAREAEWRVRYDYWNAIVMENQNA